MNREHTSNNKRGKQIKIDLQLLEELCAMQCTDDELAAVFKCTQKTIINRKRNPDFKEAYERGHLRGKVSLRRLMWRKAQGQEAEFLIDTETGKIVRDDKSRPILKMPGIAPDTTMQIWLSKNILGYVDKVEQAVDVTSKGESLKNGNGYIELTSQEWADTFVILAKAGVPAINNN